MFNKVVLATDFSLCAEQLWSNVDELKKLGTREFILVHVLPAWASGAARDGALRSLEEKKELLASGGLNVKVSVAIGLAAHEINRLAEEEGADLLLAGARGENFLREALLGNTVWELIRSSKTPILVEKFRLLNDQQCALASPEKFWRILLPTDFSEASMLVYRLVREQLVHHVYEVLLLYVLEPGRPEDATARRSDALDRLGALRLNLEEAGLTVEAHLREGMPPQEIVCLAEERDVSLVMMATRGAGSAVERRLGSTTENVARYSSKPVLLFPQTG